MLNIDRAKGMSEAEKTAAVQMAIGRIFRMGSRPSQPGDVAEYYRCRNLVMDLLEASESNDGAPCYVRDRNRGAQGD